MKWTRRILFCCVVELILLQSSHANSDINLFDLSFEQLLQVKVISAAKQEQSISEAAASISVITANQIERRGYQYLDDALRDLPGIDFIRLHGAYPNIMSFRGSYGDENKRLLLLIDGIDENSLNGSFEMGGYAYSLHNVERIEVIWGPGSALYGANALSGIINIITKHDNYADNGFFLAKGIASFSGQTEKMSYHHSDQQHAFSFSASRYSTDGPKFTNRHPDFSDAYMDKVKSLTFRYSNKQKESTTTFGGHLFDSPMGDGTFSMSPTETLGLPGSGHQNTGNGGFLNFDINGASPSLWQPYTQTVFLEHKQQVDLQWSWNSRFYRRETGIDDDSYSYFYLGDDQFRFGRWTHQSTRLGFDFQLNYQLDDNRSWVSGIQYFHDDLEKGYRATIDGGSNLTIDNIELINLDSTFAEPDMLNQDNLGLFSQYIQAIEFNGKTELTLGFRFDDNESYGSSLSPRIAMVNSPSTRTPWRFRANYGEAFRAPAVFERFSASGVRKANPSLKPEEVKTFELAASYRFKKSILKATIFNNQLDNVITAVLLNDGRNQNQNVGSAEIDGIELDFNSELTESLKLTFNYTYQRGKQASTESSFDIPNVADNKFNLGIDYSLNDNSSLYFSGNWVDDRTVAITNPLNKVDGYFNSHLTFRQINLFNSGIKINLTINNLFDREYLDPGIRSADGASIFATVHEQPGRTYTAEISYSF